MDSRPLLILVYGALLGWIASNWWRNEKESLRWEARAIAAEEVSNREKWRDEQRARREAEGLHGDAPPPPGA